MMSVQALEIRTAREADADEVHALADQLDPAVDIDRERFLEAFPNFVENPANCCLVATTDEKIRGYAAGSKHTALYAQGVVARLDEMVVEDELRHSGIGTRLVEAFEQWAASQNCVLIDLVTDTAGGFYLGRGYEAKGTYYIKRLR